MSPFEDRKTVNVWCDVTKLHPAWTLMSSAFMGGEWQVSPFSPGLHSLLFGGRFPAPVQPWHWKCNQTNRSHLKHLGLQRCHSLFYCRSTLRFKQINQQCFGVNLKRRLKVFHIKMHHLLSARCALLTPLLLKGDAGWIKHGLRHWG